METVWKRIWSIVKTEYWQKIYMFKWKGHNSGKKEQSVFLFFILGSRSFNFFLYLQKRPRNGKQWEVLLQLHFDFCPFFFTILLVLTEGRGEREITVEKHEARKTRKIKRVKNIRRDHLTGARGGRKCHLIWWTQIEFQPLEPCLQLRTHDRHESSLNASHRVWVSVSVCWFNVCLLVWMFTI